MHFFREITLALFTCIATIWKITKKKKNERNNLHIAAV